MNFEQQTNWQPELGIRTEATFASLGSRAILDHQSIALFCSSKCPGNVILRALDTAAKWRDDGVTVISGFHSPVEKECLDILLRGKQPIIICFARSLDRLRVPRSWQQPLDKGRLLIVSPFLKHQKRPTTELARQRNEFIVNVASEICFAYISPGGQLEGLLKTATQTAKPIFRLDQ